MLAKILLSKGGYVGIDGFWWFYKVEESKFSGIQLEFELAAKEVPILPEVPVIIPPPETPSGFLNQDDAYSVMDSILVGRDLSWSIYHEPFNSIVYRILEEEFPWLSCEDSVDMVMQSRVLPPAILLAGIGRNKFSQLPGYLGNILLHPNEVERSLPFIASILTVEWESYFERAKLILDYAGFDNHAAKDVSDVLEVIPRALEKVKAEGAGLLALTAFGCL